MSNRDEARRQGIPLGHYRTNILIESSINTNEMYFRVNEKVIYVIDITLGINESIFSSNEQQKVY